MGEKRPETLTEPAQLRVFMKGLLNDLRALERIIAEGRIESGVRRIGLEQELFLIDRMLRPAPVSLDLLKRIDDPRFTTELGLFNLEINLDPLVFKGDCLRRLEGRVEELLDRLQSAASDMGIETMLAGCLPTLDKSDLHLGNITPLPRYHALNAAISRLRGEAFEFRVTGTDELIIRHESVMLEACNASCQVHFQVAADEFARLYNIAQVVTAPVLAMATNSPILFGRRLWHETRIALFQQAVDTRAPGLQVQDRTARVSFGNEWVRESVLEIFREDIARFRVMFGVALEEDPFAVLESGEVPQLRALQLHNSTVYRWNRPCYGVCDGVPHLRIENRALPAGPTVLDEIANAAFWLGLMSGLSAAHEDIREVMEFDTAKENFFAAARNGMQAPLMWLDGHRYLARELVRDRLLPLAEEGLRRSGVASEDIERYLDVIGRRAESGVNGSVWQLQSLMAMRAKGTTAQHMRALVAGTIVRQKSRVPVDRWANVTIEEAGGLRENYHRVEQYMSTDLFTVHEDELVDLVANMMDWRHIRHVPVEDGQHRLVGLVSYRSLLRFLARDLPHGQDHPVAVRDVMSRDPIHITPDTSTLDAIRIMREKRVACLPVVRDERLVGIVTERDFLELAAQLVEPLLGDS